MGSVVAGDRAWFGDADRPQRTMRVTAHPEEGVVTLSLWDGSRCTSTVRVPRDEVPTLIGALAQSLAAEPPPRPDAWRPPPPPTAGWGEVADPEPPTVPPKRPVPGPPPPRQRGVPPTRLRPGLWLVHST